jgi:RHS repeat-associated protein
VEETRSERNLPYKFTGKELDPETGLYYFGARYYDPVVSVWVSVDPIIGLYLNGDINSGVYNPKNLGLYTYVHHNPATITDPNGEFGIVGAAIGAFAGVAIQGAIDLYNGELSSAGAYAGAALGGAVTGATAGLGSGLTAGIVAVGSGAAGGATSALSQAVVDGQDITAESVAEGAAFGAAGGALGAGAGKIVKTGLDKLSPHAKGLIGEAATELKYAAKGYVSGGKAAVQTGGKTATGRTQHALYDHEMKNIFAGKQLTVESKFNNARLTPNQQAASSNVSTPGGLILDRTTSQQMGNAANSAVRGGSIGVDQ